jgi:hypothetical protein
VRRCGGGAAGCGAAGGCGCSGAAARRGAHGGSLGCDGTEALEQSRPLPVQHGRHLVVLVHGVEQRLHLRLGRVAQHVPFDQPPQTLATLALLDPLPARRSTPHELLRVKVRVGVGLVASYAPGLRLSTHEPHLDGEADERLDELGDCELLVGVLACGAAPVHLAEDVVQVGDRHGYLALL